MELADNIPEVADPKESSSGAQALVSPLGGGDVDLQRVANLLEVKLDSVDTLDEEKLFIQCQQGQQSQTCRGF